VYLTIPLNSIEWEKLLAIEIIIILVNLHIIHNKVIISTHMMYIMYGLFLKFYHDFIFRIHLNKINSLRKKINKYIYIYINYH